MGAKNELIEWLSLAPADFPVWGAGACVVGMKFVKSSTVDWVLASLALILTVVACFIGMKNDDKISSFSNTVKKIAYPLCVIGVIVLTYINFTKWN